jgi:hypothetical protein
MLDLYLMGLIPSKEVPPIQILKNPNITDHLRVTAESVATITIQDLIAKEGGERIPAAKNSPKSFNIAFIVVKNKAFTAAEYAFYSLISKYFASTAQGEFSLTTFYTATGGRATLNPRLPVTAHVSPVPNRSTAFQLHQNYPNPFNPSTTIQFRVVENCHVQLNVFNTLGQVVAILANREFEPGAYQLTFDATGLPAGIYCYQIQMGEYRAVKKMVVLE